SRTCIAGRGQRNRPRAQRLGQGDANRSATRLERPSWVEALLLQPGLDAQFRAQPSERQQWCGPFTQAYPLGILAQRQQLSVTPEPFAPGAGGACCGGGIARQLVEVVACKQDATTTAPMLLARPVIDCVAVSAGEIGEVGRRHWDRPITFRQ